jgi:hypothetical protein
MSERVVRSDSALRFERFNSHGASIVTRGMGNFT